MFVCLLFKDLEPNLSAAVVPGPLLQRGLRRRRELGVGNPTGGEQLSCLHSSPTLLFYVTNAPAVSRISNHRITLLAPVPGISVNQQLSNAPSGTLLQPQGPPPCVALVPANHPPNTHTHTRAHPASPSCSSTHSSMTPPHLGLCHLGSGYSSQLSHPIKTQR